MLAKLFIDSNSDEESLLRQMVSTIVSEVSPETIILFGSRARGDARPDSDVDLLVVESRFRPNAAVVRRLLAFTWR
jgi:predicted nucleotidyltransferase